MGEPEDGTEVPLAEQAEQIVTRSEVVIEDLVRGAAQYGWSVAHEGATMDQAMVGSVLAYQETLVQAAATVRAMGASLGVSLGSDGPSPQP